MGAQQVAKACRTAIVMQSVLKSVCVFGSVCVCVWGGSVRRRTLNAAGALQNSVSVHGDDEDAQVATRGAIDRNQNGPSSAAQSGSVAQPSRAAQMANAFFAGMLSTSCAGLNRGGGAGGLPFCRLITASKQIRLKLMRRFAFISSLAGRKCNCKQTQWQ